MQDRNHMVYLEVRGCGPAPVLNYRSASVGTGMPALPLVDVE